MSFEIDDIVKLSPIARKWKDNNGNSFINYDNLQFEKEYVIKNSIIPAGKQWVDINASDLIFPAWCFLNVKKSNSGLKTIEPTIISTGIPGVTIIRYND